MKINISLSAFPYDVDHIKGPIRKKTEQIYTEYRPWKKHADAVNTKYNDDDAEIESNAAREIYSVNNVVFALWDFKKKVGTVSLTGKHLESVR